MALYQGFSPLGGLICARRAAAVPGPPRARQGMKKGRRPRRRPSLKLSDKAGPDQCPVPGENALFPAQIAGFLAVSRPVPVYPVFLKYVVPVHALAPPMGFGNNAGRPLARASRAYFRDLYCFQSRSSAACLTRRPCLVCHCMSRPISCPACQGRPQAESLAGRWGRVLARCGVGTAACYPHCWYALFKEQRRGRYFPLPLSSPKRG